MNTTWEQWQFYYPLFLSSLICIVTFVFVVRHVISMRKEVAEGYVKTAKEEEREAEQRGVFYRLGFQLAVMSIIFLPDSFSYYIVGWSKIAYPTDAYTVTTFMWKMESWMVALMWFSNLRIQAGIKKLPFIVPILDAFGCGEAAARAEYEMSKSKKEAARSMKTVKVAPELEPNAVEMTTPAGDAGKATSPV